ncbi:hypothetical protein IV500_05125 [Paeniglutamicibacter antarcticus]|uniref:Uncharacterized protein n=1 Tax=Arthrobacter terrae TaxID=2935737 RepID=A0A931CMV4_9MICC|nr:hypothetical protein [Arthrobacter terrae]MBG0738801.1 hypothetical protein [Arthrobacter terrae]
MKFSRSNYDKPHRCPGWSGPAWKSGPGESGCEGGSLAVQFGDDSDKWERLYKPHWTMYRCVTCGIYVLPSVLKNLDPSWWTFVVGRKISNVKDMLRRRVR